MILSMTGFGRSQKSEKGISIQVELKSLNSRYREFNVKIPLELNYLENEIVSRLKSRIERGKINVTVQVEEDVQKSDSAPFNEELLKKTYLSLEQTARDLGIDSAISMGDLIHIPTLFETSSSSEDLQKVKESLALKATDEACTKLIEMRNNEGNELARAMLAGLKVIEENQALIEEKAPLRIEESRKRLHERIAELLGNEQFDKERLELEIAMLTDKLDVQEEFVRLSSHIKFFREAIQGSAPGGRKLNFLTQEMNREINTIGSKANNAEIQHLVVHMKEVLEQIREQVQNVE